MTTKKWICTLTESQKRRIGKTLEELGELVAVCARIQIQGIDDIDPSSGKTNRQRLHEETADVMAQISCNMQAFAMPASEIDMRAAIKVAQMAEWEAAKKDSDFLFNCSEGNCNTCSSLRRVPFEKRRDGLHNGVCVNPDSKHFGDITFHPNDPLHMYCYSPRGKSYE